MAKEITDSEFYAHIKEILLSARTKVYSAVNFAMVEAYWEIGKSIVEKQGGNATAEYGTSLLKELSKQMTADFGKGFTVTNLSYMRQFYLAFRNRHALRDKLSWTHYRLLMRVEDDDARKFYADECIKANWSTRQLERQINTFSYQRLLVSHGNHDVVDDTANRAPRYRRFEKVKIEKNILVGYAVTAAVIPSRRRSLFDRFRQKNMESFG